METGSSEYPVLSGEELAARKKRNRFLALGIIVFMGLIFVVTLVRMREGVARNQDWQAETSRGQSSVAQSGEGTVLVEEVEIGDE